MAGDPFQLQRKILRSLVRSRPAFEAGLESIIEGISPSLRPRVAAAIHSTDWPAERARARAWLECLFISDPPPAEARALWFEVPEVDLNEAMTSVSAFRNFDPLAEEFGFGEGRLWPEDERGTRSRRGC